MMMLNTINNLSSGKDKGSVTRATIPNKVISLSFENASGSTIIDDFGIANATDVNNNARLQEDRYKGLWSGAFNGIRGTSGSTYRLINLPSNTYTTNGISVSMWIKRTGNSATDHFLFRISTTFYVWGQYNTNTCNVNNATTTNFTITSNQWTHIVVTLTSANVCNIYVNNVQVRTNITVSGAYPSTSTGVTGILGGVPVGNGGSNFMGYIDDFRIYNKILTTTEIQALYGGITN